MDLLTAVRTQPSNVIKNIVEQKGIPIDDNWTDYAVLNEALKLGKSDVSKYLLEKNCRVNLTETSMLDTPLHHAIKLKDIDIVNLLLEKKAAVDIVNSDGDSPLHLAFIYDGQSSIVDLLLTYIKENAVYTNSNNQQGLSHFHIACTREDKEIVKQYLKKGASMTDSVSKDSVLWSGYTALHFAVHYKSLEAVKVLSVEVEKVRYIKQGNIRHSCTKLLHKDIEKSLIIADLITKHYSYGPHNLFRRYHRYDHLLYFDMALARKDTDTIKNYFANGVNLDGYEDSDKASEGDSDEDESTNINKEDEAIIPSLYPLHLAVESSSKENVELLLDQGANVKDCNYDKMTPLHLALYNELPRRDDTIVDLLYRAVDKKEENHTDKNGLSYLHIAVTRNDLKTVEYYLDAGNSVDSQVMYNERDFYHFSPLHFAVMYKNKEMAKLLIDRGANVNLCDDGKHGTPLALAVERGNISLIDFLLESGADVKAVKPNGNETVLHNLVQCLRCRGISDAQPEPEKHLFQYFNRFVTMGCDVNAQNNSGNTALHKCAAILYHITLAKCIARLLECGSDVNLQNHQGKTPLELLWNRISVRDDVCESFVALYDHVEKLKALGMMVHQKNLEYCKEYLEKTKNCEEHADKIKEKLSRAEKERLDEIAKLKQTVISDCKKTSLYDLLIVDTKFTTIKFSVNFLGKILKDENLEKLYPSYAYLIRLQCQRLFKYKGIKMSQKRAADDQVEHEQKEKRHRAE